MSFLTGLRIISGRSNDDTPTHAAQSDNAPSKVNDNLKLNQLQS